MISGIAMKRRIKMSWKDESLEKYSKHLTYFKKERERDRNKEENKLVADF